ncbi:MAG TPA: DUF2382 domain-containing protein [Candidatus Saccharimonadales bacterium]|nr:DUF2382 domain-containing protein [Candidatus Saccharimonadales bacterium]
MKHEMDLKQFIGYDVVDRKGNSVGRLECLWSDHTGKPAFLGVRTGWFLSKTHVVPARRAEASERGTIRLPYTELKIKQAPCYESELELNENIEREVDEYYSLAWEQEQTPAPRGQEEATVQLSREEVKVGKREVEYAGVRIRKIIKTEIVNQPVELKREEIIIERIPAGQYKPGNKNLNEEEVYIPLRREEPVVQKESHVIEEIHARKRVETEHQVVSEQVRREDVEIEGASGQPRMESQNTDPSRRKAVFGILRSEEKASLLAGQLKAAGFPANDISVIFSDKKAAANFAAEEHTKAPEGASTGALTGGAIGGTLGWLAGIGALAIPGVGPLIAAGPIMGLLTGAAVGGAAGGVVGALVGLGIPEHEARHYEERLKQGHILAAVHCDSIEEADRARTIFERNNAEEISSSREEIERRTEPV